MSVFQVDITLTSNIGHIISYNLLLEWKM